MPTKETLWAVFAFAVIFVEALARLRDAVVKQGVITPETRWLGWAASMTRRKQRSDIVAVLQEIGFTGDHLSAIRHLDGQPTPTSKAPLEFRLFEAIRPRTKQIEGGYHRGDVHNSWYVDAAGESYYPDRSLPALKEILHDWLVLLTRNKWIPRYDCLIANKDGNQTLVVDLCRAYYPDLSVAPIVCKGEHDPSRASVPGLTAVDFEGLLSFLELNKSRARLAEEDPSYKFKPIMLDDNCTTGTSLCSAAARFNDLVREWRLPFDPVEHAVVLFNLRSQKSEEIFRAAGLTLHSLMAFGDIELERISKSRTKELMLTLSEFKDFFGCESSLAVSPPRF